MHKYLYYYLFFYLLTSNCLAEDTCLDCAKRKLNLCSEECALVPVTRTKDCQKLCVTQYCTHRCNTDANTAELEGLFNLGCEECKEQQFPLCNSSCDTKSEYKKATCQIDCTIKRCQEKCK